MLKFKLLLIVLLFCCSVLYGIGRDDYAKSDSVYGGVLSGDTLLCEGDSLLLSINGYYASYFQWKVKEGESWSDITGATEDQYCPGLLSEDIYEYTVALSSDSISWVYPVSPANGQTTITVNPVPLAYAGEDVDICIGESVVFSATGGTIYYWSHGAVQNSDFYPDSTQLYIVTVTNEFGCSGTDDITVNIKASPNLNAGDDQYICNGEATTLHATGGDSYFWSNGHYQDDVIYPSNEETYFVTATTDSECSATDDITIFVNPLPQINLGKDTSISQKDTFELDAGPDFNSYLWQDNSNNRFYEVVGGNYNLGNSSFFATVVDNNECSNSDTIIITINISTIRNSEKPLSNQISILYYSTQFIEILFNDSSEKNLIFELFDINGKLIMKQNMYPDISKQIVQFGNIENGSYFVRISGKSDYVSKRIYIGE